MIGRHVPKFKGGFWERFQALAEVEGELTKERKAQAEARRIRRRKWLRITGGE